MDEQIEQYLQGFVDRCIQASAFSSLPADQIEAKKNELSEYFNRLVLETLVENVSDDRLSEFENLDFATNEAVDKIQLLAAEIPGFMGILDTRLEKEASEIVQSGIIPSETTQPQ